MYITLKIFKKLKILTILTSSVWGNSALEASPGTDGMKLLGNQIRACSRKDCLALSTQAQNALSYFLDHSYLHGNMR